MTVPSVSGTPTTAGGSTGLSSVNHQGGAGSGSSGDYFICTINAEDGSSTVPDLAASGYTAIAAAAGSANAFPGSIFYGRGTYRARTGSEGATISLSGTSGLWTYASDIRILNAGGTFQMSGYDTVESGTTIDIPAVTVDAGSDNALAIAHIIDYDGGADISGSGWTEIMDTSGAAFLFTKTVTQGASTGTMQFTATGSRTRFGGYVIIVHAAGAAAAVSTPTRRRPALTYR